MRPVNNIIFKVQNTSKYQTKNLRRIFFILTTLVLNLSAVSLANAQINEKLIKNKGSIPKRYIVVFNEDINEELKFPAEAESVSYKLAGKYGGKVDKMYTHVLKGY